MFDVNGTTITLSRGDTGAIIVKATVTKYDGTPYTFKEEDRAVFSIKSGNTLVKEKYAPLTEQLYLSVHARERVGGNPITATLDKDTFRGNTQKAGVILLHYNGSEWEDNRGEDSPLTFYGVSVTGTPIAGDEIRITYAPYPFDQPNWFPVVFYNRDTDNLAAGSYSWDVRYVLHPYYDEDGKIVDGNQVITPNNPMNMGLLAVVGEI